MTNMERYTKTLAKFGSMYLANWNPRYAWKFVPLNVVPYSNQEFIPILEGKIRSQRMAVRPTAGLAEKYEAALEMMLMEDPKAQALNPDFNPAKPEMYPDKFWAYFHSLK